MNYFKYYQKELLEVANSPLGRWMISSMGQELEGKIVGVTPNAFIEKVGREYRATIFEKDSLIRLALELESKRFNRPVLFDTSTFNPVSGANSPVDGYAARTGQDEVWSSMRGGVGVIADVVGGATTILLLDTTSTTDQFANMYRSFFAFNTSSLSGASISAATFSVYITAKVSTLDLTAGLYLGTLASNANVVAADYQGTVGNTTAQSDTTQLFSTCATSAYLDFVLNATGRTNINQGGVTILGMKTTQDASNTAPTWASSVTGSLTGNYADVGSNMPKLVVTFTPAISVTDFNYFM